MHHGVHFSLIEKDDTKKEKERDLKHDEEMRTEETDEDKGQVKDRGVDDKQVEDDDDDVSMGDLISTTSSEPEEEEVEISDQEATEKSDRGKDTDSEGGNKFKIGNW